MKRVFTFFLLSIAALKAHSEVDMREGAFQTTQTDLKIQIGKNETWEMKREYNSRSTSIGFFGLGWCSDLDKKLTVVEPHHIILKNCYGDNVLHYKSSKRFPTAEPPAVLVTDGDSTTRIARIADGYLRRLAGFMTEKYNLNGQLIAFTLSPGQEVRIQRLPNGQPKQILLPGGIRIEILFHEGRITGLQAPLGLRVSYSYLGHLLSGITLPTLQNIKLEYDEAQNLVRIRDRQELTIHYDLDRDTVSEVRSGNSCKETYAYEVRQGFQISTARTSCPKRKSTVVRKRFDFVPVRSAAAIYPQVIEGDMSE